MNMKNKFVPRPFNQATVNDGMNRLFHRNVIVAYKLSIESALDQIETCEFENNIDLHNHLVGKTGYSSYYFRRMWQASEEIGLKDYFLSRVLYHMKRYQAKHPSMPLAMISERYRFHHHRTVCVLVRRLYNLTPTEFYLGIKDE